MQLIVSDLHGHIMFANVFVFIITAGIMGPLFLGPLRTLSVKEAAAFAATSHSGSYVAQ